ncbi:hypothetical protein [Agrobacterium tomkonis]|uniref:hypothetical protein n=1 Tax=Agrobacterium tomkonis TaxID=1183410 RepID=UPI003D7F2E71
MTETYGGHPQTGAKHDEFVDISSDHNFPQRRVDMSSTGYSFPIASSQILTATAPEPGLHGCRCLGARNARRDCGPPGLFRRSSRGKFIPKRFCRRMKRIYHRAIPWLRTAKFRDRDNRRYKCFRHLRAVPPAGPEQARSPGQFQARAFATCEPLPNKMLQEKARINGLLVCKPISASCAKFELTVLNGEVTLAAMDREEDDG